MTYQHQPDREPENAGERRQDSVLVKDERDEESQDAAERQKYPDDDDEGIEAVAGTENEHNSHRNAHQAGEEDHPPEPRGICQLTAISIQFEQGLHPGSRTRTGRSAPP